MLRMIVTRVIVAASCSVIIGLLYSTGILR